MFRWGISQAQVEGLLRDGLTIERYPDDLPYPSRLVLGFVDDRPMHVVVADVPDQDEMVLVTVYEPDPGRWDPGFRVRRLRS
jgi:hypothetical protein